MIGGLVQALQIACLLAWLWPMALWAPQVIRTLRGKGDWVNALRVPCFFMGLSQVEFSARWLIWPHSIQVMGGTEMTFWLLAYVQSALCAVAMARGTRFVDRTR